MRVGNLRRERQEARDIIPRDISSQPCIRTGGTDGVEAHRTWFITKPDNYITVFDMQPRHFEAVNGSYEHKNTPEKVLCKILP
jgi:hypothetical protein